MSKIFNTDIGKKSEVRAMFNSIARSYDFLNHFLSMGIDRLWRRKLIRELKKYHPERIIDIATGTADLSILAANYGIKEIIGIDLSEEMLAIGANKIHKKNFNDRIKLELGDAEETRFNENYFDAAVVSFGVRNFENLEKGLFEIKRILKNDKPLMVLEFSMPTQFPVKQLYNFYSFTFLPYIGRIISKDSNAYDYLPESIMKFPYGEEFISIMKNCGYKNTRKISLTFKIATIYIGEK